MPTEPAHRHNGGPLSDEMREKLWNHVRALEVLDEQAAEVRLDQSARKELAKKDGFDINMIAVILKRRKAGEGETRAADDMVRIYEDGLRDQGALPLEQTRSAAPARRSVDDVARDLHGEAAPEGTSVTADARSDRSLRDRVGDALEAATEQFNVEHPHAHATLIRGGQPGDPF